MSGNSGTYGHINTGMCLFPDCSLQALADLLHDREVLDGMPEDRAGVKVDACLHLRDAVQKLVLDYVFHRDVDQELRTELWELVNTFDRWAAGDSGRDTLADAVDCWNVYAIKRFA